MDKNPTSQSASSLTPSPKASLTGPSPSLSAPKTGVLKKFESKPSEGAKLPLPDGVVVLEGDSTAEGGRCSIYLVGVCVGLEKSCEDVKTVINLVKPDVVFFQVCKEQAQSTFAPPELNGMHLNPMLVGYEEGKKCGARLDLGDISWDVQILRALGILSADKNLRSKFDEYKKLIENDETTVEQTTEEILEELKHEGLPTSKLFPDLDRILVHERSMFMSTTLLKVAREFKSIVTIVGWAHLDGIKEHWKQPVDIKKLFELPCKRPTRLAVETLKLMHMGAGQYMDHVNLLDKYYPC